MTETNQTTPHILLAEDDINLGNLLKEYLEIKGYKVQLVRQGDDVLVQHRKHPFDLLVLDVMMPRKDGFSVAREIRKGDDRTPIIFLTAKAQKEDKIEGFEAGADDYLTKPFSMEELLLRIRAILKRSVNSAPVAPEQNRFQLGSFIFDHHTHVLSQNGKDVHLSTKEADLLKLLCQHQNNILLREEALRKIWGDDDYFTARSMDVYITKLRKFLKEDSQVQIMNVHGKGYKLIVAE